MSTTHNRPIADHAATPKPILDYFKGVLNSEAMQELAKLQERKPLGEKLALELLKDDFAALEKADAIPPEILSFMVQFVDLQIKNLGPETKKESAEDKHDRKQIIQLKNYLYSLEDRLAPEQALIARRSLRKRTTAKLAQGYDHFIDFLQAADPDYKLPYRHRLEEHQQQILRAVERHNGLGQIHLIRAGFLQIFRAAEHVLHEMQDKKNRKYLVGVVALYAPFLMLFAKDRINFAPTSYYETYELKSSSFDLHELTASDMEAFMSGDLEAIEFEAEVGDKLLVTEDQLPGHYEFEKMVGPDAYNWAMDNAPWLERFSPYHASKILDGADNVQKGMDIAYEGFYGRMGDLIAEPVQQFLARVIFNEQTQAIILNGAEYAERGVVIWNSNENIVLHGAMSVVGAIDGLKASMKKDDEYLESSRTISNFLSRSIRTSPLTYAATLAAVIASIQHGNGFAMTMWAGAIAVGITETLYKWGVRPHNRPAFNSAMADEFAKVNMECLDGQSTQDPDKKTILKKMKGFCSRGFVKATAAIAGIWALADIAFNQGHGVLAAGGGSAVVVPYLGWDLVEDNIAHVAYYAVFRGLTYPFGFAAKKVMQQRDTLEKSYIYPDHLKRGTPESQWKDQQNKLG